MTNQPTAPFAQADPAELNYIERPFTEAWTAAGKLAADETRTAEYRRVEIRKSLDAAAAEAQARANQSIADLEAKLPDLRAKAMLDSPAPEQAAQLLYLRDELTVRWKRMNAGEMQADLQAAITTGDTAKLRVYRYHGLEALHEKLGFKPDHPMPGQLLDLAARLDEALATPDQRKARAELAKTEATIQQARSLTSKVARQAQGWRLNGKALEYDVFGFKPLVQF